MSDLNHIIDSQQEMFSALARAEKGELKIPDLKPFCGVFGVLIQRNDLLAVRVRIPGGELPVNKMKFLAELAAKVNPGYIHFSSRHNIQMHDATPGAAAEIIRECTANGLPFRGGGGDSFRNISATISAGVADDGSFDLIPYAQYLTDAIFDWDEAFQLPRKLKLAFASANDSALALRQDLGFVATRDASGNPGFTVYGGGGFGRNAAVGLKLIDFIPPAKLARATRAMVRLFSEHGNRQNRSVARIRYIAARLGADEFTALYLKYYEDFKHEQFPPVPDFPADWNRKAPLTPPPGPASEGDDYRRWLRFACKPTRFAGEYSVMLFVPRGVLPVREFGLLTEMLAAFKIPAVRFSIEQNVLIPSVPAALLPRLYAALKELPVDLTFATFQGQLNSCIGASVCKAGILDVPPYAVAAAEALDDYFRAHPAEFTAERANAIVTGVHFSGCPNSCVSHQVSRFGFQGTRKRIDDVLVDGFTVWRNADGKPIGTEDQEFIPAAEMPARLLEMLKEAGML